MYSDDDASFVYIFFPTCALYMMLSFTLGIFHVYLKQKCRFFFVVIHSGMDSDVYLWDQMYLFVLGFQNRCRASPVGGGLGPGQVLRLSGLCRRQPWRMSFNLCCRHIGLLGQFSASGIYSGIAACNVPFSVVHLVISWVYSIHEIPFDHMYWNLQSYLSMLTLVVSN